MCVHHGAVLSQMRDRTDRMREGLSIDVTQTDSGHFCPCIYATPLASSCPLSKTNRLQRTEFARTCEERALTRQEKGILAIVDRGRLS